MTGDDRSSVREDGLATDWRRQCRGGSAAKPSQNFKYFKYLKCFENHDAKSIIPILASRCHPALPYIIGEFIITKGNAHPQFHHTSFPKQESNSVHLMNRQTSHFEKLSDSTC
jgi:hypothetical protein